MIYRLMSNNQWKCDDNQPWWEERGLDCSAPAREKSFVEVYRETHPDILGLQEVSPLMLDCLMRGLKDAGLPYAAIWGRDTPILYRTDRFETVFSDFLIYPKAVPGLEGEFNNGDTKSYCLAVFRSKDTRSLLTFMTTHLWWKSDDPAKASYQPGSGAARGYQMGLAIDRLDEIAKEYPAPQVILGDFNTAYHSEPIDEAFRRGFTHAHDTAVEYAAPDNGYHACFPAKLEPYTPKPFEQAIDHILVRGTPEGFVRRFERYLPESYLPLSDHAPVWADVCLN